MSERPDKQMSDEEADRYRIEHAGSTSQERFYTSAELALNQAAIVREAAKLAEVHCLQLPSQPSGTTIPGAVSRAILAIPTDQPALDRHDAELKAQTAAMLENLIQKWRIERPERYEVNADYWDGISTGRSESAVELERLIPTDHAAALAERVQQGELDERERCCKLICQLCADGIPHESESRHKGYAYCFAWRLRAAASQAPPAKELHEKR